MILWLVLSVSAILGHMSSLTTMLSRFLSKKKHANLCLIGEVNTGKSTLANKIGIDFAGKEISPVSEIPHETREIAVLEKVDFSNDGKELELTIIDMPGIATQVDWREFTKYGLSKEEAMQRAKEATKGIVDAIKHLNSIDIALVVMDSTKVPFDQVNLTLLGALEMQKKPFIIVANKIDLPNSSPGLIQETFPQHKVVPISALKGEGIDQLYQAIAQFAS